MPLVAANSSSFRIFVDYLLNSLLFVRITEAIAGRRDLEGCRNPKSTSTQNSIMASNEPEMECVSIFEEQPSMTDNQPIRAA